MLATSPQRDRDLSLERTSEPELQLQRPRRRVARGRTQSALCRAQAHVVQATMRQDAILGFPLQVDDFVRRAGRNRADTLPRLGSVGRERPRFGKGASGYGSERLQTRRRAAEHAESVHIALDGPARGQALRAVLLERPLTLQWLRRCCRKRSRATFGPRGHTGLFEFLRWEPRRIVTTRKRHV